MKTAKIFSLGTWFSFLLILLWMVTLSGCKASKPVVITEKITETTTEKVHDTVFEVAADTSSYAAVLGIVDGSIVVKEVTKASAGKKALLAPKVKIKGNTLTVDCEQRAQELLAQWIEKQTTKSTTAEVPVYIEHPLTFIEKFQIWSGRIFLFLLIVALIIWCTKKYLTP